MKKLIVALAALAVVAALAAPALAAQFDGADSGSTIIAGWSWGKDPE